MLKKIFEFIDDIDNIVYIFLGCILILCGCIILMLLLIMIAIIKYIIIM